MNYSKKKVLVFIVLSCSIFVSSLLSSQMVYSAPGVFNLQIKELADVVGKYSYYVTVNPFPDRHSDYRCTISTQLPRGVTVKAYKRSDRDYKYPLYLEERDGRVSFTARGDVQLRIRFELRRGYSLVRGFSLDLRYDEIKSRKRDRKESTGVDRVYSRNDEGRDYPERKKVRRMPASSSSSVSARRDERGDSRHFYSDSVKDIEVRVKQEISRLGEGKLFVDAKSSIELCRQIGSSRNIYDLFGNLQSFNNKRYKLNEFVVNACLKALRNINGSIELIDTLLQVAKSKKTVGVVTISTVIQAFVAGGNYPKAKELYNSYSGLRVDRTVNIMLKAAGGNNEVDFMLQLFNDNPTLRDAVTLNTLIQQLANNKCYPKAKELYNSHSNLRDEITVAIMLKAAGGNDDVDFMLQLFNDNPKLRNVVTLTMLIQQLANNKCYPKAKEVYNSHSSLRDDMTVNIMLKVAGENKDVVFMLQFVKDNPTLREVVTLTTLIQQLANNKCYAKAKELYNSYSSLREDRTVNIMLKAAGENNDFEFMLQLFNDNPRLRNVVTLTTLIQQLANNKCYPKAKELYNSHFSLSNDRTVNVMLKAAGENNDVGFAEQLFNEFKSKIIDNTERAIMFSIYSDIIGLDKARPLFNEFLGSFEKLFSPVSEGKINLHEFSKVSAELFLEKQVDELFKSNNVVSVIVGKGAHVKETNEDGEHKVLEGFNSFLKKHPEIKAKKDSHNAGRYYLTRDTIF